MKTSIISTTLIALAVAASACGPTKTNPTADYKDLPARAPEEKPQKAPYMVNLSRLWIVMPDPLEQVANFVEGEQGEFVLETRAIDPSISYKLSLLPTDDLKGATLTPGAKAGDWVLRWTPPTGTLRRSDGGDRNIYFKVRIDIVNPGKPEIARDVQEENGSARNYMLTVSKTAQDVTIDGADLGSPRVVHGEMNAVTLKVKDPSASAANPPSLEIKDDNDKNIVRLKNAVQFEQPKYENGVFVYEGKIDTSKAQLPNNKKAKDFIGRFIVRAKSQATGTVASVAVDIVIEKKTEPETVATAPAAETTTAPKKTTKKATSKGKK